MNFIKPFIVFKFLLFVFCAHTAIAQEKVTLRDFIVQLETDYDVNFSYDVDKSQKVSFVAPEVESLAQAIEFISQTTPFDTKLIKGGYYQLNVKESVVIKFMIYDEYDQLMPGAVVVLNEDTKHGTMTDGSGTAYLKIKPFHDDSLVLRSYGHRDSAIAFSDLSYADYNHIKMTSAFVYQTPIILSLNIAPGVKSLIDDQYLEISTNDYGVVPGMGNSDILYSMQAMPGVSSPDGRVGEMNIRGSSADQTMTFMDDLPLYYRGHYFGSISPFSASSVKQVRLYRGSFHPSFSGRVGAAIDMRTVDHVADSVTGSAGIDFAKAWVNADIPVIPNKLSINLSQRSSYQGVWESYKLQQLETFVGQGSKLNAAENDPNLEELLSSIKFRDFFGKLNTRLGKRHSLSASYLFMETKIRLNIEDISNGNITEDRLDVGSSGIALHWESDWTRRLHTKFTFTNSTFDYQFSNELNDTVREETRNSVSDVSMRYDINIKVQHKSLIQLGLNYNPLEMSYFATVPSNDPAYKPTDSRESFPVYSTYFNYVLGEFSKFKAHFGGRLNHIPELEFTGIGPQIFMSYRLTDSLQIRGSLSRNYQYSSRLLRYTNRDIGVDNPVWTLADGNEIPVISSNQYALGGVWSKGTWTFDLEGYFKVMSGVSLLNETGEPNEGQIPVAVGKSDIVGADLLAVKKSGDWTTWVGYTISKANYLFPDFQAEKFPSIYDQRHNFKLYLMYTHKDWEFTAGFIYGSGLPTNKFLLEKVYQSNTPPAAPDAFNYLYSLDDRFDDYHELDLSVKRYIRPGHGKWTGLIVLSARNIYDYSPINGVIVRYPTSPSDQITFQGRIRPGIIPNLLLELHY